MEHEVSVLLSYRVCLLLLFLRQRTLRRSKSLQIALFNVNLVKEGYSFGKEPFSRYNGACFPPYAEAQRR